MDQSTLQELASRGGKTAAKNMTPAERAARSAKANEAKRRKRLGLPEAPSKRWWCLYTAQEDGSPKLEFSSQDKAAVREYSRQHKILGWLDYVEYNPLGFKIEREFAPDPRSQLTALKTALEVEE